MSRTVTASLVLTAAAVASLSALPAAYELHLVEAAGVKLVGSAAIDATSVTCSVDVAGSYVPSVVCVDASGNVVTHADGTPLLITGPTDPIVVTDPVVVTSTSRHRSSSTRPDPVAHVERVVVAPWVPVFVAMMVRIGQSEKFKATLATFVIDHGVTSAP